MKRHDRLECIPVIISLLVVIYFGTAMAIPRDVGGTLFGGMFRAHYTCSAYSLGSIGLIGALFLRLPYARASLLLAGSVQTCFAMYWLLNYPDDHNGALIWSPTQNDFSYILLIGVVYISLGILTIRKEQDR